ncbi:MAG: hypothetical protein WB390_15730, partial [Pseudolabrys sp.]
NGHHYADRHSTDTKSRKHCLALQQLEHAASVLWYRLDQSSHRGTRQDAETGRKNGLISTV